MGATEVETLKTRPDDDDDDGVVVGRLEYAFGLTSRSIDDGGNGVAVGGATAVDMVVASEGGAATVTNEPSAHESWRCFLQAVELDI